MNLWYDKIIGPVTLTSNIELGFVLGARTLIQLSAAASTTFQIVGLNASGGNHDGAVVTFVDVSNVTHTFQFLHESVGTDTFNRFRNASSANFSTSGIGAVTYRYDGSIQRWFMLGHT